MKCRAAVALAKMGKGVPRNFSKAERNLRRKRLELVRLKRWPQKPNASKGAKTVGELQPVV